MASINRRETADNLVLASSNGASEALRATVTSADAVLRGEKQAVVLAADDPSRAALVELGRGCRGASPQGIAAFGEAGRSIAMTRDGADAFVNLLATGSLEVWQAAVAAIGRCGPALLKHHPEVEMTIAESGGGDRLGRHAFAAGMELRAGEHASEAELTVAEASGQWHVVARALLERVRRAAPIAAASLQRVRSIDVVSAVKLRPREEWAEARGCGFSWTTLPPDQPLLRMAAALVLAAGGQSGWRSTMPAEVATQIAEASVAGELPALARQWIATLRSRCLGEK